VAFVDTNIQPHLELQDLPDYNDQFNQEFKSAEQTLNQKQPSKMSNIQTNSFEIRNNSSIININSQSQEESMKESQTQIQQPTVQMPILIKSQNRETVLLKDTRIKKLQDLDILKIESPTQNSPPVNSMGLSVQNMNSILQPQFRKRVNSSDRKYTTYLQSNNSSV
jgi:hypothetical protein